MNRIKKANNNTSNIMPLIENQKEYGQSDLNWEDSGGNYNSPKKVEDPSMNDYLKGYQMNPYEFKQWAMKNVLHQVKQGETINSIAKQHFGHEKFASKIIEMNDSVIMDFRPDIVLIVGRIPNEKTAAKEIIDISYTPENIAKEILTLWSQADGPLQNFFDGFTMNKMTNDMKKQVAEHLKTMGYDVVPVLVDETPRYAKAYTSFTKVAKGKDVSKMLQYFSEVFPDSKLIAKVAEEIKDVEQNEGIKVDKDSANGLIDYYKQIFPDDYAKALIDVSLDNPEIGFEDFKDLQLSDKTLNQMEKFDSENQNPTTNTPNDGGLNGYDFTTQTRPDGPGGVAPTLYETRANRIKKK